MRLNEDQAIKMMTDICPCLIAYEWDQVPEGSAYRQPVMEKIRSKLCSFYSGTYNPRLEKNEVNRRDIDFILIAEGLEDYPWAIAAHVAHEVGHALDNHGLHPAKTIMGGGRQTSRYRAELAAVSFEMAMFMTHFDANVYTMDKVRRQSLDYLYGYKPPAGLTASLDDVIAACMHWERGEYAKQQALSY